MRESTSIHKTLHIWCRQHDIRLSFPTRIEIQVRTRVKHAPHKLPLFPQIGLSSESLSDKVSLLSVVMRYAIYRESSLAATDIALGKMEETELLIKGHSITRAALYLAACQPGVSIDLHTQNAVVSVLPPRGRPISIPWRFSASRPDFTT